VKYIDPTYMVRACRANASDAILCTVLGQNAVSFISFNQYILLVGPFNIISLIVRKLHESFSGPWSVCWVQWHHIRYLQHTLCLPSHPRGHHNTEAREPQQQDVASLSHVHWPARFPLTTSPQRKAPKESSNNVMLLC
jgi:hypothetical protein